MKKLRNLRQGIDNIDVKIVRLLNQRIDFAKEIGKLKRSKGKGLYSADRESKVLSRIKQFSKGPLSSNALNSIYREIMSASLSMTKKLNVAYLGPVASFTHLAALKKFGTQVNFVACDNITDIFFEVEKASADYGVVPIENSIEGAVTHTLDMFVDSDLKICSQIILEVSHNLLSKCKKNEIKRAYSNPQVFGQCRRWLELNLPRAELIEVASTSRAAEIASKEKKAACIASDLAAKHYKLRIVASDIEDVAHNITRFLVIGKEDVEPTGKDRTSILFSIKDKVGALYDMLAAFKRNKINLTKIESRPSKLRAWDYFFFIDLNGHRNNPKVKKALKELEKLCKFVKVLGSYPIG